MDKIRYIVLALIVTATTVSASFTFASQTRADLLKVADTKTSGEYVRARFLTLMKKTFDSSTQKKALIIGDSHAQDFLNSVLENDYLQNYQIRTRYIPAHCQIYLGADATQFIKSKDKILCQKSDSLALAKKQIKTADLIILAANWKQWAAKRLPQTIKKLGLRPEQKLFVIGRKSFGKIAIRNYLRMSDQELRKLHNPVNEKQKTINKIMNNTLSENIFIDVQQLVCGSSESCPVFTEDLKLISFDGGHLTKYGAQYIGKTLFQNSKLADL